MITNCRVLSQKKRVVSDLKKKKKERKEKKTNTNRGE